MFGHGLQRKVQSDKTMNVDYPNVANYVCIVTSDGQLSNAAADFSLTAFHTSMLAYLDYLSADTQKYIRQLCELWLDDNFAFDQSDSNIKLYSVLMKFIPCYFEIMEGCLNIYDLRTRLQMVDEINQLIGKMKNVQNNKLCVGTIPFFGAIMGVIEMNIHDETMDEFIRYVTEKYKTIKMMQKQIKIKEINQPQPIAEALNPSKKVQIQENPSKKHK
jgi:hypothetical protein